MIDVDQCVDELERRWTTTLGNVSSDALRQTWGVLFGSFNWHAKYWKDIKTNSPNRDKFTVLNFATGTAKTQSLVVLGDHLSRHPKPDHPGVLVVQRFIKDATLLVKQINTYREDSTPTAVTYNSETPDLSLGALKNYPFLVITHAAYQNACAGRDLRDEDHPFDPTNWEHFMDYEGRTRRLVIIDEAMQLWRCAVAYWGNLDGRNDWDKYDTCIVFGLPYMPPQVSANAIMAIQRPSDDSFLRDKKLRQSVRNSQMAVPIIQGMNRIRSRKTIDSAGNCAPCHWYLPLSSEDNLSDAVEHHIEVAMPELNVDREWNFLQLPKTGALGKLLVCLEDLGPGEYTRAEVLEASGKSTRQFTTMIQEFKAGHVPGVSYERRRGGCVFVVKAQLQAA